METLRLSELKCLWWSLGLFTNVAALLWDTRGHFLTHLMTGVTTGLGLGQWNMSRSGGCRSWGELEEPIHAPLVSFFLQTSSISESGCSVSRSWPPDRGAESSPQLVHKGRSPGWEVKPCCFKPRELEVSSFTVTLPVWQGEHLSPRKEKTRVWTQMCRCPMVQLLFISLSASHSPWAQVSLLSATDKCPCLLTRGVDTADSEFCCFRSEDEIPSVF